MKYILIVDDDADIRLILNDALENAGYSCLQAENSFQALQEMEQFSISLIITDLNMPGIDGLQLIETLLQKRRSTETFPFILLTGDLTQAVQQRARQAGAIATITKPFSTKELLRTVGAAYANMNTHRPPHQTLSREHMSTDAMP